MKCMRTVTSCQSEDLKRLCEDTVTPRTVTECLFQCPAERICFLCWREVQGLRSKDTGEVYEDNNCHSEDSDGVFVPMSCCVPVTLQSDDIVSRQNSEQRDNLCQIHAILYPNSRNSSQYLNTKVR